MAHEYCMHCMEHMNMDDTPCVHCRNAVSYEAPVHHMKPGTVLKEKYLIGRAIGEGGFGITYIGRDLTLDMRIAVKEFYPNGYSHRNHNYTNDVTLTQSSKGQNFEKDMQRFLNEARMLAKFSNEPGIVGVRDFFRENGTAYIVMEYLDGITLKTYLQKYGPIPANKLFEMIDPVLVSLTRVHDQGMIHRDISPDNIMVLKNGQLKLLDFGAAREVVGDKSLSVVLKHGYAPEEQYRTKGKQGPWTDVYAMCATIYKCLTGVTPMESLERVYNDELVPPSKLGVAIAKTQEAILLHGLKVRIGDRIQSISDLRSGLQITEPEDVIQSIILHKLVEIDELKTMYESEQSGPEISIHSSEQVTVYQVTERPEADSHTNEGTVTGKEHISLLDKEKTSLDPETKILEKREDLQPDKDCSKKGKKNKPLLIAIAVMLVVCILLPAVLKSGLKNPRDDIQSSIPTERAMAGHCSTVLKRYDVSGSVLDLNIKEELLNEKYKTLVITCSVTVLEGSTEKQYVVDLYYEYENDAWALSDLSKIKE